MKKIAIIEDERSINTGIALALGKEEYSFYQFYNLADIKDAEHMDLLILDICLPDGSGLDFLKEFRKRSQVPVLILTANDTEMDEVMGLELGANDYITKPFSLMVLRLRVQKLLSCVAYGAVYDTGDLYFDFDNLRFEKDGMEIELSKTEIRLLRLFTENEGVTLTRDRMIAYVWQEQEFVEGNALSVMIKRLRDKIEDDSNKHIHTVYGIGYVWKR